MAHGTISAIEGGGWSENSWIDAYATAIHKKIHYCQRAKAESRIRSPFKYNNNGFIMSKNLLIEKKKSFHSYIYLQLWFTPYLPLCIVITIIQYLL
jgi:hypothetical protein